MRPWVYLCVQLRRLRLGSRDECTSVRCVTLTVVFPARCQYGFSKGLPGKRARVMNSGADLAEARRTLESDSPLLILGVSTLRL